jgi:hypothetical protein
MLSATAIVRKEKPAVLRRHLRGKNDALMHIAVFGFTLYESKKAIDRLARG